MTIHAIAALIAILILTGLLLRQEIKLRKAGWIIEVLQQNRTALAEGQMRMTEQTVIRSNRYQKLLERSLELLTERTPPRSSRVVKSKLLEKCDALIEDIDQILTLEETINDALKTAYSKLAEEHNGKDRVLSPAGPPAAD